MKYKKKIAASVLGALVSLSAAAGCKPYLESRVGHDAGDGQSIDNTTHFHANAGYGCYIAPNVELAAEFMYRGWSGHYNNDTIRAKIRFFSPVNEKWRFFASFSEGKIVRNKIEGLDGKNPYWYAGGLERQGDKYDVRVEFMQSERKHGTYNGGTAGVAVRRYF